MDLDALLADLNAGIVDGASPESQRRAIATLVQTVTDQDLPKLLQPAAKSYWSNAAEVLALIGFPRLNCVGDGLVRWLQDMNWPGARRIYSLLLELDEDQLVILLEGSLQAADKENDSFWIYWLGTLIDEKGIRSKFSTGSQTILARAER
ncbi:MAG: DUF5071 domain-containing protein [Spirochaetia bacterium]|nr:DUF5071 domain-containing protein [Spirochaetia bacterium]